MSEQQKTKALEMGDLATKVMIWIVAGLTAWTLATVQEVKENQAVLIYQGSIFEKRIDKLEAKNVP